MRTHTHQWRSQPKPDARAQYFYPHACNYLKRRAHLHEGSKCPIYLGMHAYNTLLKVHV